MQTRKDGVSAFVFDTVKRRVLGGFRKGSHGPGAWATPGGHVEPGESLSVATSRELEEETGIKIAPNDFTFVLATTDDFSPTKLYTTHHLIAKWDQNQQPVLKEENKCEGWHWLSWSEIISLESEGKLFLPMINFFRQRPNAQLRAVDPFIGQVILLCGPAGSGKGTQGQIISNERGLIHISTGELYRKEFASGSERGKAMNEYMVRGEIVPDALTFDYLKHEFSKPVYQFGFMLDGYPKNDSSLVFLRGCLAELGIQITCALYFNVPSTVATDRLLGRWMCKKCEKNYQDSYVPPKQKGICDSCGQPLYHRNDDTTEGIAARMNVFQGSTAPLLEIYKSSHILFEIKATASIPEVSAEIQKILNVLCISVNDSSYVLGSAKPKSTVFHNHVDANTHQLVKYICQKAQIATGSTPSKIYPISQLFLGPQYGDPKFSAVYKRLPNFHTIKNVQYEAFATGQMGDQGIDYDHLTALLSIASTLPNQGVMIEVEEDILSVENGQVLLDVGNTPYKLDSNKLNEWKKFQIENVPEFELHHGIDIVKNPGSNLPIQLDHLTSLTRSAGLNVGGWFLFAKKDVWAYRCNEFYYGQYADARKLLEAQVEKLKEILLGQIPNKSDIKAVTYSLEKVHCMFSF